jgi:hypothetical protein
MISDAQRAMIMHARALVDSWYEAADRGDVPAGITVVQTLKGLEDLDMVKKVYALRITQLGYTPLHVAVTKGHIPFVEMLLRDGANINHAKMWSLYTPLHIATLENNHDMIKYLCSYGHTDINATDQGGWTPLHWASHHHFEQTVALLKVLGANEECLTISGSTAAQLGYAQLGYGY